MEVGMLQNMISAGEQLTVEFKSDRSGTRGERTLEDETILSEAVALANSGGGYLLIGVEDDGEVTGLNPQRRDQRSEALQAFVFNNTQPPISTETEVVSHLGGWVMVVRVLSSHGVVFATTSGKMLRREMTAQGPETRIMYPYQVPSLLSQQRQIDYSEQILHDLDWTALDPLELERTKQMVERNAGRSDASLVGLDAVELAKALGLVVTDGSALRPTIAGLLVAGREAVLRRYLPMHHVLFQRIDERDEVRINDSFRQALLSTLEAVEQRFAAQNQEQEVMVGLFRLSIPDYSQMGFREALLNAIVHRDYAVRGEVFIQWRPDHLLITNPGGFMPGITLENLIYHEPLSRNPLLVDIFKRLGLVERTARGVDRIFQGQLRFGRPAPDYSRSDASGVRVLLPGGRPSLEFARLVYQEEKAMGKTLPLDQLMALNHLFFCRRTDAETLAKAIHRDVNAARALLENLVEQGWVEASGNKKGRTYHFAAKVYAAEGNPAGYVRAAGLDPEEQEQRVRKFVKAHGRIERKNVMDLCKVDASDAFRILQRIVSAGEIVLVGKGRSAYYRNK